jgi:hypothetical protein
MGGEGGNLVLELGGAGLAGEALGVQFTVVFVGHFRGSLRL